MKIEIKIKLNDNTTLHLNSFVGPEIIPAILVEDSNTLRRFCVEYNVFTFHVHVCIYSVA